MVMIILLLLLLGADLGLKFWIENRFSDDEQNAMLKDWILIRKLHNKGLALGKMQEKEEEVKTLSAVATAVIAFQWLVLLTRKGQNFLKTGMTFLLAGGLGNLINRLKYGYVIDFVSVQIDRVKALGKLPEKIRVKVSGFNKLVFNLADLMIALGAVIVLIYSLFKKKK